MVQPLRSTAGHHERSPASRGRLPFATLFDHVPELLVVTDEAGLILHANQPAVDLLGRRVPLTGMHLCEVLDPVEPRVAARALRSVGRREVEVCEIPATARTDDGEQSVLARGRACALRSGTLVVWALHPVEEGAVWRLEQERTMKDALLLSLSHDLRSPLATLTGALELLEAHAPRFTTEARVLWLMDMAVRSVQSVISNVLDLERLQHGRAALRRDPTDLALLVEGCIDRIPLRSAARVEVPSLVVDLDAGLTERILVNLLTNADNHNPPCAEIRVRAAAEPGAVHLTVEDEGPGIPDDRKGAVFELFERLDSTTGGMGVGLFLVRQFAVAHGGSAWFTDRAGGGTVAHVRLSV